jgi:S1-C subfamily serine protease
METTMQLPRVLFIMVAVLVGTSPRTSGAPETPHEAPHDEATGVSASPQIRQSLVKVLVTSRFPDLFRPWSKQEPREVIGSGVVISGSRILTTNHVVNYASRILVEPDGSSDKLVASVKANSFGKDLAVLTLDDPSFFKGHPPLEFATVLPEVGQPVVVYGYAVGGDSVSVTKGSVSRIEEAELKSGRGLRIQVDAAVNPGDSGGPAVVGDKFVGLAFKRDEKAEKTAYLIPLEEITAFLDEVKAGLVRDRPKLPIFTQSLENPALRAKLGLDGDATGLLITRPEQDDFLLRPWDVISAIGPHPIDNAGLSPVQPDLRLAYDYYVPKLARDGNVAMTVLREAKPVHLDVPTEEVHAVYSDRWRAVIRATS